jgi:phosphoribosylformylglycinamidine cyclo-ligase
MTVGEALLQPHVSYLPSLGPQLDSGLIKGLAHITGGGLTDNIPRILPEGTAVEIVKGSWPVLPIYKLMQTIGNVPEGEMFRTFNMGVGMVIVTAAENSETGKRQLKQSGAIFEIGRVVRGNREVTIK